MSGRTISSSCFVYTSITIAQTKCSGDDRPNHVQRESLRAERRLNQPESRAILVPRRDVPFFSARARASAPERNRELTASHRPPQGPCSGDHREPDPTTIARQRSRRLVLAGLLASHRPRRRMASSLSPTCARNLASSLDQLGSRIDLWVSARPTNHGPRAIRETRPKQSRIPPAFRRAANRAVGARPG
jgi:hypothetical protein